MVFSSVSCRHVAEGTGWAGREPCSVLSCSLTRSVLVIVYSPAYTLAIDQQIFWCLVLYIFKDSVLYKGNPVLEFSSFLFVCILLR